MEEQVSLRLTSTTKTLMKSTESFGKRLKTFKTKKVSMKKNCGKQKLCVLTEQ